MLFFIFIICLQSNSNGNEKFNHFDSIYSLLAEIVYTKNFHYIKSKLNEPHSYEIQKYKLKKGKSFFFHPNILIANNSKPWYSVSSGFSIGNWQILSEIENTVDNQRDAYTGSILIPILNSNRKTISHLEDIIYCSKKKTILEIELVLLANFKDLLIRISELNKISDEILIRKDISVKIKSMYNKIYQLKRNGLIAKRISNNFKFYMNSNIFALDVLKNQKLIAIQNISSTYSIPFYIVESLPFAIDSLMNYLRTKFSDKTKFVKHVLLQTQIDSLNQVLFETIITMQKDAEYNVSIGPKIRKYFNKNDFGIGVQCNIDIQLPIIIKQIKPAPHTQFPISDQNIFMTTSLSLDTITNKVFQYVQSSERIIKSAYNEIRLGNTNSIYTLIEFYDKLISNKLNLHYLRHAHFISLINYTQSLSEYPFYSYLQNKIPVGWK